jgi:BirA family transcriptional regulator, biotin operon repressor / biotin---[acetyl-CoA-carboxylase] ligase
LTGAVIRLDSVGSTNDEARRLAQAGAAHFTAVVANQQTAGRGRDGRTWVSPPGNLYVSVILRPDAPAARLAGLALVAAVALGEALAPLIPPSARLSYKWPNDLLVDRCKLAGILIESEAAQPGMASFAVVGVGVNCRSHPDATPYPATDLRAICGRDIAPEDVLNRLMSALRSWLERWEGEGMAPVCAAWRARAEGIGEAISVRLPHETIEGRFVDIDPAGMLIVATERGEQRIAAGDVFLA